MFVDENLEFFADARLVAHELGHGLYSLQHTFDYPALENVETDNLMDYNGGDFLAHFQWKLIQNPTLEWSFLQDDEDGWKTVIQNVLLIGYDIVWVIDGAKYEDQKNKVKEKCEDAIVYIEDGVTECSCSCSPGESQEHDVYYFEGNHSCLINKGKIKKGEMKKMAYLYLDKDFLDVKKNLLDACTHVYKHDQYCVEKSRNTGNELGLKFCQSNNLELYKFNVRPCYSFVECKVGNETIYLKPNSSDENFPSEIKTNSDSIYLYPLFFKDDVHKASGIKDRCKLKIEDYPYLLKEIKFNDSAKSFDNSRALLAKERQLDIPSKFKLKEGVNTYSVNGMEVKIIKTGAGR
jgi:hypothetical protein